MLRTGAYGAVRVLSSRTGRYVAAGLTGALGGLAWTRYVSGPSPVPRLPWVSLVLALAAVLLAAGRAGAPPPAAPVGGRWRRVLVPPWSWSAERLVGLAVLLGLAAGVAAASWPG